MEEEGSLRIWLRQAATTSVVSGALLCQFGASFVSAPAEAADVADVPAIPPAAVRGADSAEAGGAVPASRARKSRSSKGKGPREKEADGTEARNRFKADPVLKSRYQLNGEPLEVDPD